MPSPQTIQLSAGRSIRRASEEDLPIILALIEQGRRKMIASGNPNQWSPAHPSPDDLKRDIQLQSSYLLYEGERPIATFAFLLGPDPNYDDIEGEWLDDAPYYVIHRVASADGVRGVMADVIAYCQAQAPSIRIDTHADNHPMQAALLRQGFVYCGFIFLEDEGPRLAYQLRSVPSATLPEPAKPSRLQEVLDTAQTLLLLAFFLLSFRIDSLGAHLLQTIYIVYILGTSYLRYRQGKREQ